MRTKYRYPTRIDAEAAVSATERKLHLHEWSLNAVLRDEVTWTGRITSDRGSWFRVGFANLGASYGGLVLVQQYMPTNANVWTEAHYLDEWRYAQDRERAERDCTEPPASERRAFWTAIDTAIRMIDEARRAAA